MPASLPRIELAVHAEDVIDVRVCAVRQCPHLQTLRGGGVGCTAGVFRARFPKALVDREMAANPSSEPSTDIDDSPMFCRMLVHRESALPQCGVARIEHTEKVLVPDPADSEEPLFPDSTFRS